MKPRQRVFPGVAIVAVVAVLAGVMAFALRGGNAGKVVPLPIPHPDTEAAPSRPTPAMTPVHGSAPGGTAAVSWQAKFDSADNLSRFVKEALPAAQQGDGRAAYLIWLALTSCSDVISRYHDSADPEAQLQQEIVELQRGTPGVRKRPLSQWVLDNQERKTRSCLGLAKEGAPGGHDPAYWQAKALAAGDPIAQADAAREAAGDLTVAAYSQIQDDVKVAKLKVLHDNLRAVVESGDLDALFQAGEFMANPYLTNDTLSAMAVALAACELGANCRQTDSNSGCVQEGTCPAGADWAYFMQTSMGPELYGQLYARAQQVVQLQRAGDTQGVLAYLKVDEQPTILQRYRQEHKNTDDPLPIEAMTK